MCGIAGIMMRDGSTPSVEILDRLGDALAHRGPDGTGKHIAGPVGLVQTRLAIIDLKTGDQPLYDPNGAALVGNGEIYNYLELRDQLSHHTFQTQSDCETPLYLYRDYGTDYAEHLRGMYALAIHDPTENLLIISRDPFGIKPLYYLETEQFIAFASEAQALISAGLVARLRWWIFTARNCCSCNSPAGMKPSIRHINRVMPGETLVIRGGRITERKRQRALPAQVRRKRSAEQDALERLDKTIRNSIDIHQRSDVPIWALFLSGGIDSSALLADDGRDE